MSVITSLDDITLVPTPVRISAWTRNGREERIDMLQRGTLFEHDAPPRPITVVLSNVYGDPFVDIGRLTSAVVGPRRVGGWSPWQLSISLIEPRKRTPTGYTRDFPAAPVLLLWGQHTITLDNLP